MERGCEEYGQKSFKITEQVRELRKKKRKFKKNSNLIPTNASR